jgi:hypothetical protein
VTGITVRGRALDQKCGPLLPGCLPVSVVRQARLNPEFGWLYPELSAGNWLPAWQVAMQIAERLWQEDGSEALVRDRLLRPEHFDFQGGTPRSVDWYVTPERLSDATADLVLTS